MKVFVSRGGCVTLLCGAFAQAFKAPRYSCSNLTSQLSICQWIQSLSPEDRIHKCVDIFGGLVLKARLLVRRQAETQLNTKLAEQISNSL